jgi:hypothetical protein
VVAIGGNVCTEADLLAAAGQRSFDRGVRYLDAVQDLAIFGNQVTASVRGTDEYIVVLTMGGSAGVTGACDCPYGKEGFFCKHCVAVGLAFLRDARRSRTSRSRTSRSGTTAARTPGLHSWLSSLSREDLFLLVVDQIVDDDDWRRRLELRAAAAAADIDAIGERLVTLLDATDFGQYGYVEEGESRRYAKRVEAAASIVDGLVAAGSPGDAVAVAEYAIDLVADAYSHAIDPANAIWNVCVALITSHHAACVADAADRPDPADRPDRPDPAADRPDPAADRPDPAADRPDRPDPADRPDATEGQVRPDPTGLVDFLARRLLDKGDFPAIDIARYTDLLGPEGLALLRERLTAAWQQAPVNWKAQRAIEGFLRTTGDIDALVKVREANLPPTGLGYLEIAKELQAAGRADEALAWAERALHSEANPPQAIEPVADFVVERYLAAGRVADAVAVRRDVFGAVREMTAYERLRAAAERAGTWPADREWALGLLRAEAEAARSGRPGIRLWAGPVLIDVLISEGEVDAAWEAAAGVASETQWLKLADLAAATRPADALGVYLRQIQPLKTETGDKAYERMARLLDGARACHVRLGSQAKFDLYLRALRADQKRKHKLIRILDARQLTPR